MTFLRDHKFDITNAESTLVRRPFSIRARMFSGSAQLAAFSTPAGVACCPTFLIAWGGELG